MSEYQCAICGGTFDSPVSDEEALKEFNVVFPGSSAEGHEVVCDDCFKKLPCGNLDDPAMRALHEEVMAEVERMEVAEG